MTVTSTLPGAPDRPIPSGPGYGRRPALSKDQRGGAVIAVSLVLTLVGAALFVVSLFRSDDLNIVLLCIGCALLAAVFLAVGALRSRPSRKPVLASGATDRAPAAPEVATAAAQPAGATSLRALERDEEPQGWAPPGDRKAGTTAALEGSPARPDDTGWRRPERAPAPARPVALDDDLPDEDSFEEEVAEEPEPEREPEPVLPRASRSRPSVPAAKRVKKAAGTASSKPRAPSAKKTPRKATTTKAPAAKPTTPAPAKATKAAPARKAPAAAKAAPAARASRASATPTKAAKSATPPRAKSASPPAKKAQAAAVEIGLSARDAARVEEVLGPVSGLGPAKRAQLLRFFGTWRRLRNASVERLTQVPGITQPLAERIRAALDE